MFLRLALRRPGLGLRDDGRVPSFLRDGQWRCALLRRRVDLRAVVQQQPRRVDVALKAGDE